MQDLIRVMKALSDETRLRILNVLLERECCVCEIMQALDISQSRASRNLSTLYNAGFLNMRKDSQWSLYSINQGALDSYLGDLTSAITKALAGNELARIDRERLRIAKRVGPECARRIRIKAPLIGIKEVRSESS